MGTIDWRCERCDAPATVIDCNVPRARRRWREHKREYEAVRDRHRREAGQTFVAIPPGELPFPPREHWAVLCDGCMTEEE